MFWGGFTLAANEEGAGLDDSGARLKEDGSAIGGLFACGEMVGGIFFNGDPGGSGPTSGIVFGERAGGGTAAYSNV